MDAYMISFRIIHILSAILWAGSAAFYSAFVGPSMVSIGPHANKFFNYLVRQRKATAFFRIVSTLTVVAGGFLYWRDSGELDIRWFKTGLGIGLTVGAIAGLFAWLLVQLIIAPTANRLSELGERIDAAGSRPSDGETASVQALSSRLRNVSNLNVASLAIAAVAMSMARYLAF